jgi:hypothetical protein
MHVRKSRINYGMCFTWAYLANIILPASTVVATHGHCFLKVEGKYYDALLPEGGTVNDIYQKSYGYNGYPIRKRKTQAALAYWRGNGDRDGLKKWQDKALCDLVLRETLNDLQFNLNVKMF